MSDTKDIRLSDYEKSASAMGESLYEPSSTLAYMDKYDNMILSNIPMIIAYDDDNFEIIDFSEIASRIDAVSRTFCRPFLITGNSGCGKRTLEKYFSWKFYNYFYSSGKSKSDIDESICYYEINTYDFLMYSNEKCCDMINSVFRQIKEVCVENIDKIKYISFGDITDILDSKKMSKIFVRCLKMLMNIPKNMCIITCVYDGEASELKEKTKSPFIIENLTLPDKETRYNFFSSFIDSHKNIVFEEIDENDPTSKYNFTEKLSDITEEFNFRMLSRLIEYIAISVKGQVISDIFYEDDDIKYEKYMEFVGRTENKNAQKGYIFFSEIEEIIEKIKKNIYIPPAKNTLPFVVNAPSENHISNEEKNKPETYDSDKSIEEQVGVANTIAELESRNYKKQEKVISFGKDSVESEEENQLKEQTKLILEKLESERKEQIPNTNEENPEHTKLEL